jgi:hypothetical protein
VIVRAVASCAALAACTGAFAACGGGGRSGENAPVAEPEPPATTKAQPQAHVAASGSSEPERWTMYEGLGWSCASPVVPRRVQQPPSPLYSRYEMAFAKRPDGAMLILISGSWDISLQSQDRDAFARAYFESAKREMGMKIRASSPSTFMRDGLTCQAEDVSGDIDTTPVELKILLCEGRGMMIAWAGTPSRLTDVLDSCRFSPIAPP